MEELSVLRTSLPWESWRAVQEGRVYVADGNAYFNRHRDSVIRVDEDLKRLAF